jgi:hypothetical protein
MAGSDVQATLEIRGGLQGGTEQWSREASLTIGADGFHDPEGIGFGGDSPSTIDASAAAALLLKSFDRAELTALFDRLAALRAALGH